MESVANIFSFYRLLKTVMKDKMSCMALKLLLILEVIVCCWTLIRMVKPQRKDGILDPVCTHLW